MVDKAYMDTIYDIARASATQMCILANSSLVQVDHVCAVDVLALPLSERTKVCLKLMAFHDRTLG